MAVVHLVLGYRTLGRYDDRHRQMRVLGERFQCRLMLRRMYL
jgi:hypothetical protein